MSDAAQQIAEFCAEVEERHVEVPDAFPVQTVCMCCSSVWSCDAIRGVKALRELLTFGRTQFSYRTYSGAVRAVAAALRED